jgi:hypothetical protein
LSGGREFGTGIKVCREEQKVCREEQKNKMKKKFSERTTGFGDCINLLFLVTIEIGSEILGTNVVLL